MRVALCVLLLVLIALTLATPGDADGYRKKKNRKNKKNNKPKDEDKADDFGHEEDITHLTCVAGFSTTLKTRLTTCKTELTENCVTIYIAPNEHMAVDSRQYIYSCKKPGLNCKAMKNYIENEAPPGSYCKGATGSTTAVMWRRERCSR